VTVSGKTLRTTTVTFRKAKQKPKKHSRVRSAAAGE
jgi:hypothetical protein